MSKSILFFLCLLLASTLSAQEIEIEGHVLDSERNDLIGAAVRCFDNDSLLVKSTVTDSKGDFTLHVPEGKRAFRLRINYLGYKELTLILNPTEEKLIRLGDITLSENTVQVQEVTVIGKQTVRTEDKTMVYPTREQLRHAYDGYSALTSLMIPGVKANMQNSTPTYLDQEIFFCINGMEATQEEVNNLNPRDIKRVDFYPNGRSDYPEADVVLDYVLKERDYAGSVALNGKEQLNRPYGYGRGTIQYFQKKSEFALSVSDKYTHAKDHNESYTETTYGFPGKTIINTSNELPSRETNNHLSSYFNYIYKDKKQTVYSSFRMNRNMEKSDIWTRETFSNMPEIYTRRENKHSLDLQPALRMRYNRVLKNEQRLRVEWYGNRGNNDYKRWYAYHTDDVITSSYSNATDEKSWHTSFKTSYSKTFKNRSSLSVEGYQDFTRTDNRNIREGNASDVYLSRGNTRLYATYDYRIKNRLNLQFRLAEQLSFSRTRNRSSFDHQFIPSLQLTFTKKAHNLRIKASFRSTEPSASDMTTTEYKDNEYMLHTGNPALRNEWKFNSRISYTWTRNNLSLMPYIQNNGKTRTMYEKIDYSEKHGMFISRKENGGLGFSQQYGLNVQYEVIPQRLFIGAEGAYAHISSSLWKNFHYNAFFGIGGYTYFMYKGFSVNANCSYINKNFDPSTAVLSSRRIAMNIQVTYNIDNWNFSFYTYNPFLKGAYDTEYEQLTYTYKSHISKSRVETGNIFHLIINYRFTFGNKKHKFHNDDME